VLRAALILVLVLVTPASGDLWTTQPKSPAPSSTGTPPERPSAAPNYSPVTTSPADADSQKSLTLTVLIDPTCPVTESVVREATDFARRHPEVTLHVLLASWPRGSREAARAIAALTALGISPTWAPASLRQLGPRALPAVYLQDAVGHGVQASGRPPLETLWREVHRRPG
jgi:hypothetical protein